MRNDSFAEVVGAFSQACLRYEDSLRNEFDELYRDDKRAVPARHVDMVLYFLMEDSFKNPQIGAQVREQARTILRNQNTPVAPEKQAQAQARAAAVNLVRKQVLATARKTADLFASGSTPTVAQLTRAMQETLKARGLDTQVVHKPEPGAADVRSKLKCRRRRA